MGILEHTIENRFVKWAEKEGAVTVKLERKLGWPDREIVMNLGHHFYIEFKRKGEKPRKIQLHIHKMLRRMGHGVYVCDTFEQAQDVYRKEEAKAVQLESYRKNIALLPEDSNQVGSNQDSGRLLPGPRSRENVNYSFLHNAVTEKEENKEDTGSSET